MKHTLFFREIDRRGRKTPVRSRKSARFAGNMPHQYDVTDFGSEPLLPEFDKIGDQDMDIRSSIGATGARRPASE